MAAPDASIEDSVGTALNMIRNVCVANLTGHPAISIPCGMSGGLPVGLMLTGRHFAGRHADRGGGGVQVARGLAGDVAAGRCLTKINEDPQNVAPDSFHRLSRGILRLLPVEAGGNR